MNTDEILMQLTPAQKTELHADLRALTDNLAKDYKKNPASFSEVTKAVHLKGNIYLNVTISLYPGDKDSLHPVIENIVQFEELDQYLEAINKESSPKK